MVSDIRERGRTALDHLSDDQLPAVVRWLELLAELKDHPDVEPEELWLLATGELKQMDEEMEDAAPITPEELVAELDQLRASGAFENVESLRGKYAKSDIDVSAEEIQAYFHKIGIEWEQELDEFFGDD